MVRAGAYGEDEDLALREGIVCVGWEKVPDLTGYDSRDALRAALEEKYSDAPKARISNYLGQLWAFAKRIEKGDLIVLPLKTRSAVAVGRSIGPYRYRTDLGEGIRHTRPVEWLKTDIPRTAIDSDLLYSFGAFMTVCEIARNRAEARVRDLVSGGGTPPPPSSTPKGVDIEQTEGVDIEQIALDGIMSHISRKFRGHALSRLVEAVLQAEGYATQMSKEGADGGIDILAGRGSMGFDSPRLCVQVKSSDSPVDVSVFRQLQGVMQNFRAEQGLFVSWGGFKDTVRAEARASFFAIRLWDASDLVRAVLRNYERLQEDLQSELPLKRVWALVEGE